MVWSNAGLHRFLGVLAISVIKVDPIMPPHRMNHKPGTNLSRAVTSLLCA